MKYKDPHYKREAKKYGRPIPSRELMLETMEKNGRPIGFRKLAHKLGISEPKDLSSMKYRLRAMERDGQILFNRSNKYVPVVKAHLIAGRVQGHPDGFGFLIPDDGSDDLYLHAKQMRKVLHGDRVLCSITGFDRKGRREGAIVEILERKTESVVGRYFVERGVGFVTPDNSRMARNILIPVGNGGDAENGQIVVARIIEYPTERHQPIGKVIETLGDHMAPGMEIDIALRSHDLPHTWPDDTITESQALNDEVLEEDKKNRVDLRKMPLVTIDGEDSRDFDDAVYCEQDKKGNWKLTVAIADVSHYVPIGSALDQEAWNRGTSVYFPADVIPMLPEKISNGLCSLNPAVDRLCMACEATIDPAGEVIDYQFMNAIMHSAARLTYTKMAAIIVDNDADLRKEHADIVVHLDDLYKLYHVLRKARTKRGSIDFEKSETRIIFSENRKIESIRPTIRNDAHKLIEECMVTANMCAARFLKKHKMPALHRVHDGPKTEKLTGLREFLGGLGLSLGGGGKPQSKDYATLLDSVKERPDAHLIQTVMLRSISRAIYAPVDPKHPEKTHHFGLSRQDYAHFTSPIRRYPDLLAHRAIRHVLALTTEPHGKKSRLLQRTVRNAPKNTDENAPSKSYHYDYADMKALGEHCSMCEQRADDASRDVISWLEAEYMQDKVGEKFSGIISTVTSFGLFVELNDIYVEGLVHITALKNDYYHFDAAKHMMKGENSGKIYRLGDPIEIVVARVNLDERKIDFVLPMSGSNGFSKRPRKKKPHPKKKYKGKKTTKAKRMKSYKAIKKK